MSRVFGPRRRLRLAVVVLALALVAELSGGATIAGASRAAPQSTAAATVWLCRPGTPSDPCAVEQGTTAVTAAGTETNVTPSTAARSFDCFYVYPTVSDELSANSDLTVGLAEIDAAKIQASRFSSVCDVYAPMYRQRTLASLAGGLGSDQAADAVAYASLAAGWADFLAHYSDRRPFVLIGDSQGAAMLIVLIRRQIDGYPQLRNRLVSAIILGGNVQVPLGHLVGGSFENVPACSSDASTGCVIAYSSFPSVPPSNALFGRPGVGVSLQSGQTSRTGVHVLCTNPAALTGGKGALLPIFATRTQSIQGISVETPWVEYPGHYSAECESSGGATYLQVTDTTSGSDPRPTVQQVDGSLWGYHADDVNLALGNLVADVALEEASYGRKHPST